MMRAFAFLGRIGRDQRGTMVIETALVTPVLVMLSVGGFEASQIIARQAELQTAAAEAAAITRAVAPETSSDRVVVRNIIASSTGLATTAVNVTQVYRCGTADAYIFNENNCEDASDLHTFIKIRIQTSHAPIWNKFGIGAAVQYDVIRTVQIG